MVLVKTNKHWLGRSLLAALGAILLVCQPLATGIVLAEPVSSGVVETPEILKTCEVVPDNELQEMRGCYDSYYFGMDIVGNFDMARGDFNMNVQYMTENNSPNQSNINARGNEVAFQAGSVNIKAGVGTSSLGTGVIQIVQVAGNNNMVISTMNVQLNIFNGPPTTNTTAGPSSLPLAKPTLTGLSRIGG